MGWLPSIVNHDCPKPPQEEINSQPDGKMWACDVCKVLYVVKEIDHGHDVMPGERQFEKRLFRHSR